jgi:hypothetical protein
MEKSAKICKKLAKLSGVDYSSVLSPKCWSLNRLKCAAKLLTRLAKLASELYREQSLVRKRERLSVVFALMIYTYARCPRVNAEEGVTVV